MYVIEEKPHSCDEQKRRVETVDVTFDWCKGVHLQLLLSKSVGYRPSHLSQRSWDPLHPRTCSNRPHQRLQCVSRSVVKFLRRPYSKTHEENRDNELCGQVRRSQLCGPLSSWVCVKIWVTTTRTFRQRTMVVDTTNTCRQIRTK